MSWEVQFDPDFRAELLTYDLVVRREIAALALVLSSFGPTLRRPSADTLKGSRHRNMKELRFNAADGVWRVAFAFDPQRRAVLLVAGDKSGVASRRFYAGLIAKADARFDRHLDDLAGHRA